MPGNAPQWEIIGQREDYRAGPTGGFVNGVVVQFRTSAGATGSVFVPDAQYTVDNVRRMVQERAGAMNQVHALQG